MESLRELIDEQRSLGLIPQQVHDRTSPGALTKLLRTVCSSSTSRHYRALNEVSQLVPSNVSAKYHVVPASHPCGALSIHSGRVDRRMRQGYPRPLGGERPTNDAFPSVYASPTPGPECLPSPAAEGRRTSRQTLRTCSASERSSVNPASRRSVWTAAWWSVNAVYAMLCTRIRYGEPTATAQLKRNCAVLSQAIVALLTKDGR